MPHEERPANNRWDEGAFHTAPYPNIELVNLLIVGVAGWPGRKQLGRPTAEMYTPSDPAYLSNAVKAVDFVWKASDFS